MELRILSTMINLWTAYLVVSALYTGYRILRLAVLFLKGRWE